MARPRDFASGQSSWPRAAPRQPDAAPRANDQRGFKLIRVAVVCADVPYVTSAVDFLRSQARLRVVGAYSETKLVRELLRMPPDVMLVDICPPSVVPYHEVTWLRLLFPNMALLALTDTTGPEPSWPLVPVPRMLLHDKAAGVLPLVRAIWRADRGDGAGADRKFTSAD